MTVCLSFVSCDSAGNGLAGLSTVYLVTAILSFVSLFTYLLLIKKKNKWLNVLFVAVCIVNFGYFLLSVSQNVEFALWANRISYFGSVFLPFSVLMNILDVSKIKYGKAVPISLFTLALEMFFIAGSPGILDVYYKSVELIKVDGASLLIKEYGVLHDLYLVYLLGYFLAMIGLVFFSSAKKKLSSNAHSVILALAVLVNIGVWSLGKITDLDFEFLSVSYIITEFFLLGLHLMIESEEFNKPAVQDVPLPKADEADVGDEEAIEIFKNGVEILTKTEKKIYQMYLDGLGTKDVLAALNIKENTLKYHNKNIYGKLGVSSRKQLLHIAKKL